MIEAIELLLLPTVDEHLFEVDRETGFASLPT